MILALPHVKAWYFAKVFFEHLLKAYHDWEHYSSVRQKGDHSTEPACLVAGVKEVDHEDVEIEVEVEDVKPKKPLTGKQKKRLRKEKAAERKKEKLTGKVVDKDDEVILNLEQLSI